jgi:hypothetical protein
VVEAELRPFERPLVPGRIAERSVEMSSCLSGVGEDAAGPGDELLEPGRSDPMEMTEGSLKDVLSFQPPVGADRGSGEIGHAQVGEDVVDRRAFVAEQLAELAEGEQVAAIGEGGDAEGPPGPGGY